MPLLQQLIPYVEDDNSKLDERVASQMRSATEERREVLEVNKVSAVSLPCLCALQSNVAVCHNVHTEIQTNLFFFWLIYTRTFR